MKIKKVATPSARLKQALELRKMKQIELAEKTGISKPRISCYLSGKYEPKQEALYQLGKALNVAEMWLAGYDIPYDRIWDHQQIETFSDIQQEVIEYEAKIDGILAELLDLDLNEEEAKDVVDYAKYIVSKRK